MSAPMGAPVEVATPSPTANKALLVTSFSSLMLAILSAFAAAYGYRSQALAMASGAGSRTAPKVNLRRFQQYLFIFHSREALRVEDRQELDTRVPLNQEVLHLPVAASLVMFTNLESRTARIRLPLTL